MLRYIVSFLSLAQALSFNVKLRQQQRQQHHHHHSSNTSPPSFGVTNKSFWQQQQQQHPAGAAAALQLSTTDANTLDSLCQNLQDAFQDCQDELAKTCKVKIAPVSGDHRLGLVATESISKGDVVLAIPYDDRYVLSANVARTKVFSDVLPDSFDSWTGETGLIALLVLHEVARAAAAASATSAGDDGKTPKGQQQQQQPQRPEALQKFMPAWISALPHPNEMKHHHPLLWSEEDQEILQMSSTNKIYRRLDDIEEDATWLTKNVFDKDRTRFPETVTWKDNNNNNNNGGETTTTTIPCFNADGFKWAMAIVQSRSFFLDGSLRLIPFLDMVNHDDSGKGEEVTDGYMGTFGTLQGAKLIASTNYAPGDEVLCSYGPKSAADYLLEHGFCPEQSWKTAVSELTFEIDPDDRFRDDKLDILEFETYDQAPMDPVQSFDVVSAPPSRDGEPDPAMIQFLRLVKLGGTDAFLLESIFRKDVWGFMELPVSEGNELDVVNAISEACQAALDEFAQCPSGGPEVCAKLRESEAKALTRTMAYLQREKEALDLKEYYQERRLKDLGLDSEWTPEDEMGEDIGFGQTRAPGGADYDW